MEEHLQVGPHLFQVLLACEFHDTCQHGEHPRGHTREVGHILTDGLTGYAVTLHLKVAEKCCFFLRHTYQIGQRIDILNENGAQVTHQRAWLVVV